jgi:4-diphosphocytidyl-2-C-methyl-D-erythritol kinase|tara:strand:- start:22 stop:873 length:852 start_codon:yes stop_codon:yes gene_type:complete
LTYLSPAKINLFLHVTSKRDDGYHNLQTIFQLLDYCDEISINYRSDGAVKRVSGNEEIVHDQDLLVRSAIILKTMAGAKGGADIAIVKKIPVGGGLGGGSSNAATVLIALNKLWNLNLSKEELMDIGQNLGADIPLFVDGHSSWGEGIGEILTPINLPKYFYLIVSIGKQITTKEIFTHKALTMSSVQRKMTDFSMVSNPHNDCLVAAIDLESEIEEVLTHLDSTENHIGIARMTGTGCCVFIAFEKEKDALIANNKLPSQWSSFVAKAIDRSPLHNWGVAKW